MVYKTDDPNKKLYIVSSYEPHYVNSVLKAIASNTPSIPESEYMVTCYWMKGEEIIEVQFEEPELTKSSIGH